MYKKSSTTSQDTITDSCADIDDVGELPYEQVHGILKHVTNADQLVRSYNSAPTFIVQAH
jgi:hypothetical protein